MMEVAPTAPVIEKIISAQANNLDTPSSLVSLKEWVVLSENGSHGGQAGELSRAIDALLGLAL
jgi:L-cysteine:1D-myo-inositol 2-amino-2-deoxy-alpha-D-glucopyranoside ligase